MSALVVGQRPGEPVVYYTGRGGAEFVSPERASGRRFASLAEAEAIQRRLAAHHDYHGYRFHVEEDASWP